MSRAAEKTLDAAMERALQGVTGSARIVRAAKIAVALPSTLVEDAGGLAARIALVDAQSLEGTLGPLLEGAPDGARVVVVAPLSRDGGRGLLGRVSARLRRLSPIELVDACDALRRAGVVEVRVVDVDGALGLAVLSGRATSP